MFETLLFFYPFSINHLSTTLLSTSFFYMSVIFFYAWELYCNTPNYAQNKLLTLIIDRKICLGKIYRRLTHMAEQKGQTRKYISEKEAAEYLGIAERTLRSWRSNGRIDNKGTHPPRVYVRGKHVYYELGELEE